MKILNFKKDKNSLYELTLENNQKILLHESLILREELLIKNTIDKLDALLLENEKYLAYDLALKYLSKKEISKKQLRDYLLKKEYSADLIDELLLQLEEEKALDDSRYLRAYLRSKINCSFDGPYKIKRGLLENEIDENMINEELKNFDDSLQKERIKKLQDKYLRSKKNKSYYVLKNSLYEYLSNLGYEKSLILDSLKDLVYDESEAREKEYQKLKISLSKKYQGEELERKIKEKLKSRGFYQ